MWFSPSALVYSNSAYIILSINEINLLSAFHTVFLLVSNRRIMDVGESSDEIPVSPKIESSLWSRLKNGATANMLISFGGEYTTVLNEIAQTLNSSLTRGERNKALLKELSKRGSESQANVVALLVSKKVPFRQFAETYKILVRNGTAALAQEIAEDSQVKRIQAEPVVKLAD